MRLDRKSGHATDKISALEKEEEQLTNLLHEEEDAMDVLQELLAAVDEIETRCCLDSVAANEPLESVEQRLKAGLATLGSAKRKHEVEFRYFRLHHLAVPALFPLFKQYLQVRFMRLEGLIIFLPETTHMLSNTVQGANSNFSIFNQFVGIFCSPLAVHVGQRLMLLAGASPPRI